MSKTDKTAPRWLRTFYDVPVVHDHRDGRCVMPTLRDARMDSARSDRHVRSDCPRYELVRDPCPGHLSCGTAADRLAVFVGWARDDGDVRELARLARLYTADRPMRCAYHPRWEFSASVPCAGCDQARPKATCFSRLSQYDGYAARVLAGRPRGPRGRDEPAERAASRAALRGAARERNAGGDLDLDVGWVARGVGAYWD